MKRTIITLLSAACLMLVCFQPCSAQETEKKAAEQQVSTAELLKRGGMIYDPAGRRDPFRDLLAGRDIDTLGEGGIEQMLIDDIVLMGITKIKGTLEGVISGPQGFPYKIKVGDKFADGFVLSIQESKVIFRKTREMGVPLYRPKDITKEINPEER